MSTPPNAPDTPGYPQYNQPPQGQTPQGLPPQGQPPQGLPPQAPNYGQPYPGQPGGGQPMGYAQGNPYGPPPPQGQGPQKKSKRNLFIGIGAAAIAAIAIVVILIFTLGGSDGVSKADYQKGVEEIFRNSLPEGMVEESQFPALAKCVTDESYDQVNEEVRKTVASGKDVDDPVLFKAGATCAQKLNIGQ